MVGPGIVSESAEIDSLTCFDEYFCSGYEVTWLTAKLCSRMKLGREKLFSAHRQGQVRCSSHKRIVGCLYLSFYLSLITLPVISAQRYGLWVWTC